VSRETGCSSGDSLDVSDEFIEVVTLSTVVFLLKTRGEPFTHG
jgi:hypothetical protein